MSEHLTDLDLELARTGEADQEVQSHLETCAQCQQRTLLLENLASSLSVGATPCGCPPIDVPQDRDAAILDMIQKRSLAIKHGLTEKKSRHAMRWIIPVAAAASIAIVLSLGLGRFGSDSQQNQSSAQVAAAGPDDINADGEVNIIDAMLAAKSGNHQPADASRIANASVALNSGGAR